MNPAQPAAKLETAALKAENRLSSHSVFQVCGGWGKGVRFGRCPGCRPLVGYFAQERGTANGHSFRL